VPLQLLADFAISDPVQPALHWTEAALPNTGFFPMTIIGSVRIDGVATGAGVVVGAFVGNELRGRGITTATGSVSFDVAARSAGEPVQFRIQDGQQERLASHSVSLASGSTLGTAETPYIIDTGLGQTIDLEVGWNQVALFVSPSGRRLRALFPEASHIVSDAAVFNSALPDELNSLTEIEDGRGYFVHADHPHSVVLAGPLISEELVIPLDAGWNYVGYIFPHACDLPAVLGGFSRSVFGDPAQLKSGAGFWLDANSAGNLQFANCATQPRRCTQLPTGAIHWFPGSNGDDILGGTTALMLGGAFADPNGLVAGAFRGSTGHVSVPAVTLSKLGDFTVEFWANIEGTSGLLIDAGNALRLERQSNDMQVRVAGSDWTSAGFSRPAGQWHHIALLRQGNISQVWIDTILFGETSVSADPLVSTDWQLAPGLLGLLDEFTIYNRALTRSDLVNIHTAGADGKCGPALPVFRSGRAEVPARQPNEPVLLLA
jgi:hypothetical protein